MRLLLEKITSKENLSLPIYWILLCAFLMRVALAQTPGFSIDTDAWFAWSMRMVETGFSGFYSKEVWTNYTPGFLYVLYVLGLIKQLFLFSNELHYFILKFPSILADLILGFLIYKEVNRFQNPGLALVAAILYLFNPAVLFNSAVWGQIDAFLTLFLFMSVYFLIRKKLVWASVFWGLAVLIKPQAIALLPVFGFYVLRNFSLKTISKLSLPAVSVIILGSLPFFPQDPVLGVFKLILQMAQDYPGNSMFAYNLWGIFGFWIDDATTLGPLSFRVWGILLLIIYWSIIVVFKWKRKINWYVFALLGFLAFYFLPTRVHERYLLPALPFLILCAYIYKSRFLAILGAALSFIHFINIYYVYVYYMEFYLNKPKLLYVKGLYESIEKNSTFLSLISVIIFALILLTLGKIQLKQKHEPQ